MLVVGLDPHRVQGPWDPAPVAAAIEAGRRRFAEEGVPVEFCLVGLDGGDDVPAVVTTALRRRPWECVVVGGGFLHGDPELFEEVVNLVHRHAPAAVIAFSARPEQTFEAATRRLAAPR